MTINDITYQFRTKPFAHQRTAFKLSRNAKAFAYLMEQGTGKTWVGINVAGYLFETGKIEALVVIAPNEGDIPQVWIEQLATHLPKRIPYIAVRARSGLMKAKEKRLLDSIMGADQVLGLRVITVNVESMRKGSPMFNRVLDFCRAHKTMCIVDESTRIKSHSSAQTRGVMKIGENCDYRRIATGTMISNGGPLDAFSQFAFLDPDILGFDSYTAYKAHYCELLPPEHGLVRFTAAKMAGKISGAGAVAYAAKMQAIIQIPARDPQGRVIYKNVPELHQRIAPHSYRVLKKDCLDLPPKLYLKMFVELTPDQRKIYNKVRDEVIAEFVQAGELSTITSSMAIVKLLRLQQVVCNHYSPDPDPDVETKQPPMRIERATMSKKGEYLVSNPRMKALLAIIEEAAADAKGIIWCRHHPELRECVETLVALFGAEKVVQLHGKIKGEERTAARHAFQKIGGEVQWLVGQVRSGIGIDLFEASWECFYSNDYSLENRKQAEDRAHRYGLKHNLSIYDLVAQDTLDEKIINSLRANEEISDMILGDHPRNWI